MLTPVKTARLLLIGCSLLLLPLAQAVAQIGMVTVNVAGAKPVVVSSTTITDLAGRHIATDAQSRVELLLSDGTTLAVGPSTSIQFLPQQSGNPSAANFAAIERGEISVAIGEGSDRRSLLFGTPGGVVAFTASSGTVAVSDAGTKVALSSGTQASLTNDAGQKTLNSPNEEIVSSGEAVAPKAQPVTGGASPTLFSGSPHFSPDIARNPLSPTDTLQGGGSPALNSAVPLTISSVPNGAPTLTVGPPPPPPTNPNGPPPPSDRPTVRDVRRLLSPPH